MKIKVLLNSVIISAKQNDIEYNFFLDAGFPFSFSRDSNNISDANIGISESFNLNLMS